MQRSLVNFMTHSKKCGEDSLIQIYAVPDGCDAWEVVRWCYKCGAVVVDIDHDNRTSPGAVMKMKFPENNYDKSKA